MRGLQQLPAILTLQPAGTKIKETCQGRQTFSNTYDNVEGSADHEAEALRHKHRVQRDHEEHEESDDVQWLRRHRVHDHGEYCARDDLRKGGK